MLKLAIRPTAGIQDAYTRLVVEDIRRAVMEMAGRSATDTKRILTLEDLTELGLVNVDETADALFAPMREQAQSVDLLPGGSTSFTYFGTNVRSRASDGALQVLNTTTNKWHTLYVQGDTGYAAVVPDQTGET